MEKQEKKCIYCLNSLSSDNPEEHVLPVCRGGKLKSSYLICEKCNHEFGSEIDNALKELGKFIDNLLQRKKSFQNKNNLKKGEKRELIIKEFSFREYPFLFLQVQAIKLQDS